MRERRDRPAPDRGGTMNERILISGAGIAGETLAFWLVRHGFQPTVIERSPVPRPGGNGVDVREHAVEVAERMGIMGRIRSAGLAVNGLSFVDASDRVVSRVDMRAMRREQGGDEVEILRGDLTGILHDVTAG